jgi:hypothetical protein
MGVASSTLLLTFGLSVLNALSGSLDKLWQRLGKLFQLIERLPINPIVNQLRKLYGILLIFSSKSDSQADPLEA